MSRFGKTCHNAGVIIISNFLLYHVTLIFGQILSMNLSSSCEVIGAGDGYKRQNKPPTLSGQGGVTFRYRSVAICTLGARVLGRETPAPGADGRPARGCL